MIYTPTSGEAYFVPEGKDDLRLVNCACCGKELLGESMKGWLYRLPPGRQARYPQLVAGRMAGRPYCLLCIGLKRKRPKHPHEIDRIIQAKILDEEEQ